MRGLSALLARKKEGSYRGEITVNCVMLGATVPRLFEMVAFLEELGVDTVYLSYPWYISDKTAALMDDYVAAHAGSLRLPPAAGTPSWYSYRAGIDLSLIDALQAQLDRVDAAGFRIKVRYNPELKREELRDFLLGSHKPAQGKTRCLSLRTRMDVFPGGEVVSCKFFPELMVGDLRDTEVEAAWRGERFDRVRETVARCGLMPVCAKCNLLYTRGA
jgi:radical SAM protein with 4Fe4S-binding SPASM domain